VLCHLLLSLLLKLLNLEVPHLLPLLRLLLGSFQIQGPGGFSWRSLLSRRFRLCVENATPCRNLFSDPTGTGFLEPKFLGPKNLVCMPILQH